MFQLFDPGVNRPATLGPNMAILLIGSTGNGKSTLGNFVVNPEKEHIFGEQQTFTTARTNKPETQLVKSAAFEVKMNDASKPKLSVIDTPGIFEDEDRDIGHMVNIIKALQEVGEIRAIILVVKFSSKVDTPYKASIRYYSKLLPGLFETNLLIVMTDYACDERSKNLRALQGIDEEKIKKNILAEIVDTCGVKEQPKLYTIDCLPMSDQEFTTNLQARDTIVSKASGFKSVSTTELKVAKTDPILAADKVSIAKLKGEVTAYDESLEKALVEAYSVHSQSEQLAKRLEGYRTDLNDVKEELGTTDTEELVEDEMWVVRSKWKWFKIQSQTFEVTSRWPIRNITYWKSSKSRWMRREKVTENCIQGTVKSKRNRGLHAKVTVEVYKCDKFREEIDALKKDIANKELIIEELVKQHLRSKEKHGRLNNDISTMRSDIETRMDEISKLSSEYLTMEECVQRFQLE